MIRTWPFICRALIISLAVLAGAFWLQTADGTSPDNSPAHEHHDVSASNASRHAPATGDETDKVSLTVLPEMPRAGERALITFTLTDGSGEPIEELLTHHARKLHVFIISQDMQFFGHIHPRDFNESIEHGEARVSFSFPQAGRHNVGVDFMTNRGSHARQFVVEVTGSGEPAGAPDGAPVPPSVRVVELEEDDRYTQPILLRGTEGSDGYTVSLQKPNEVRAGEPVSLVYRFSRNDVPLTDLRPYLDASLHLAIVKDDLTEFLHEHGMVSAPEHSGHSGHAGHESHAPATFGPEVTAIVSFPGPGTYYLFGQSAHGDKLLNSRFSIEVR